MAHKITHTHTQRRENVENKIKVNNFLIFIFVFPFFYSSFIFLHIVKGNSNERIESKKN